MRRCLAGEEAITFVMAAENSDCACVCTSKQMASQSGNCSGNCSGSTAASIAADINKAITSVISNYLDDSDDDFVTPRKKRLR